MIKSEKLNFTWTEWDKNPAQSTCLIIDESVEPDWIPCEPEHFEMWNDGIVWLADFCTLCVLKFISGVFVPEECPSVYMKNTCFIHFLFELDVFRSIVVL